MERSPGFVVVRQCVSAALVKQVAAEFDADVHKKKPTVCREKYNEYEVSPLGIAVKDDFVKNADKATLTPFFSTTACPLEPSSIHLGVFHQTHADPTKLKTANQAEVYVTIAISDLGQDNGWFTFYEGSHQRKPPFGNPVSLDLKAGDAVAWSGRLVYSHTSGGGGTFITLVYRVNFDQSTVHA